MQTFRFLPPGQEEQRGFAMQFLGTLLGLIVLLGLWFWKRDALSHGAIIGAGLAILFNLGRAAWSLEIKARRSQIALIGLDTDGLHITEPSGREQIVAWKQIEEAEIKGGRLTLRWPNGTLTFGSREVENGMTLVQEILQRRAQSLGAFAPPTNFIPLEPK